VFVAVWGAKNWVKNPARTRAALATLALVLINISSELYPTSFHTQ
jgi:hypothetical protein